MDTDPPDDSVVLADRHRTDVVALVFTDIIGSTALKHQLGDRAGVSLIQRHHALVRECLAAFPAGKEVETAGDSFLIAFTIPSAAVAFALLLQARLRGFSQAGGIAFQDRIGIHLGEVVVQEHAHGLKPRDLYGIQVDICARVMSLAEGRQILLTRPVFDNARQMLRGEDIPGVGPLSWLNHGPYEIKGLQETIEICEVGEMGQGPLTAPVTSEKAHRQASPGTEPVLGWRPAVGQVVPHTQWELEKKLGEGGFGEVWLGRHQKLKEQRVFKFCFRADRVRSLKRETTLFRVLKERVGDHPNIVRLLEVYFEEPPFYVVMDHVEGQDLKSWCEQRGGVDKVPMSVRLEIVAQIGDALQAAHDAGVIHRDVKPGNILVCNGRESQGPAEAAKTAPLAIRAKLTDFGIGQVISEEALQGITREGFTQTIVRDSSSSQTGTQMYMAPELLAGKPASTRSDIYSLGVVLYQLVVGDLLRPVTTDWAEEISDALLAGDLKRCFAGHPEQRFAGAGQLAEHLRSLGKRRAALAEQKAAVAAMERAAYRRGIMRTAAVAALILAAIALLALYAFKQAARADHNLELAKNNAVAADRNAVQAVENQQQSRRLLYAADLNLAQQSLKQNNLGRARRLLDRHRPQPGEEDLRGWEWRYLWQLTRSGALVTLTNHPMCGFSLSFSPDGSHLAAGWWDGRVELWDVPSRRCLRVLTERRDTPQAHVAFAPVLNLLAATSEPKTVRLYDLDSGRDSILWQAPGQPGWTVHDLAFSQDGSKLVIYAGTYTQTLGDAVWVVDVSSAKIESRHPTEPAFSYYQGAARLSPDNQHLYLPRSDSMTAVNPVNPTYSIQCLDLSTGQEVWQSQRLRDNGLTAMAVSPDGQLLASGSGFEDPAIRVWDAATGRLLVRLEGHTSWVSKLIFTKDGRRLISSAADQTIRIWDTASWTEAKVLRGHRDEVPAVAVSETAHLIASASKDGDLMLWNDQAEKSNDGYVRLPENLDESQVVPLDGSRVILFPDNQPAEVFDLAQDASVGRLPGLGPRTNIWPWKSGWLRRWDGANQILVEKWNGSTFTRLGAVVTTEPGRRPIHMALNRATQLLAWTEAGASNSVFLANFATSAKRTELKSEFVGIFPDFFSDDGKYLAATAVKSGAPNVNRVWNVDTGQVALTLREPLKELAFAAGGRVLVALMFRADVGLGHEIRFYNLNHPDQAPRRVLGKHAPNHLAVSPNGLLVAASDDGGTVQLCDAISGELIEDLHGHMNAAYGVAFSADGQRLISTCGGLEAVKLWDVGTRQELLNLSGAGLPLERAAWSADGDTILAGAPWQAWHAPSWAEIVAAEAKDKGK